MAFLISLKGAICKKVWETLVYILKNISSVKSLTLISNRFLKSKLSDCSCIKNILLKTKLKVKLKSNMYKNLSWACRSGFPSRMRTFRCMSRLIWGGRLSNSLLLRSRCSKSDKLMKSWTGIVLMLKNKSEIWFLYNN